jgi:hypothetical protein
MTQAMGLSKATTTIGPLNRYKPLLILSYIACSSG